MLPSWRRIHEVHDPREKAVQALSNDEAASEDRALGSVSLFLPIGLKIAPSTFPLSLLLRSRFVQLWSTANAGGHAAAKMPSRRGIDGPSNRCQIG